MKNKKLTYLLGVLVVTVWGLVIHGVFRAVGSDEDPDRVPGMATIAGKAPYDDYTLAPDTIQLLLHYRNPFEQAAIPDTAIKPLAKMVFKPPLTPLRNNPVNWNFVKYAGFIRNPGSRKLIALMRINGKSLSLQEGETQEMVKLLKNLQDSVQIRYNGTTRFIKIETGNP